MKNIKKGFTLIEMLVVVVIIGIILAIVLSSANSLLNNRSKKQYNVHVDLVESAVKTYVDQHKGQLSNNDSSCFNIDYNTLIADGLLNESDIKCNGNIIVSKGANDNFSNNLYISCVDSNNDSVKVSDKLPAGCKGFNGKFFMEYGIYEDSSKTKEYDGSKWVKDAYVYFTSTSPYQSPISHFEYTTNLDGNWTKIENGSNLGTINELKELDGNLYVRSVDKDNNVSSSVSIPVMMDNTGPNFDVGISGTYLEKKVTISNVVDKKVGTLAELAYSFDDGKTWGNKMEMSFIENKTISVCSRDVLGNVSCKETKISGIDRQEPVLTAKSSKALIKSGESKDISNFYNIVFSPLGGTVVCKLNDKVITNINQLEFGLNTLTCTATAVNTLTASTQLVISHSYTATGKCSSGTLSNNNTCSFSSNSSVCGTHSCNPHDCRCSTKCNTCYDTCYKTCKNPTYECNCKKVCTEGSCSGTGSCVGGCWNDNYDYICQTCGGGTYQCNPYDCNPHDCNCYEDCDTCYDTCASSCTRTSYLSWTCSTGGVNGNTGEELMPTPSGQSCNSSICSVQATCSF